MQQRTTHTHPHTHVVWMTLINTSDVLRLTLVFLFFILFWTYFVSFEEIVAQWKWLTPAGFKLGLLWDYETSVLTNYNTTKGHGPFIRRSDLLIRNISTTKNQFEIKNSNWLLQKLMLYSKLLSRSQYANLSDVSWCFNESQSCKAIIYSCLFKDVLLMLSAGRPLFVCVTLTVEL